MNTTLKRFFLRSSIYFVTASIAARFALGTAYIFIILCALFFYLNLCCAAYQLSKGKKVVYKVFSFPRAVITVDVVFAILSVSPILLLLLALIMQSFDTALYALVFALYDMVIYEYVKCRSGLKKASKR